MNDLMTKSFLNYVDLKKQAMKDLESKPDIEMGQPDPSNETNLSNFFKEVDSIKADMEEIQTLLLHLQEINKETKSTQNPKFLRGLRDRMNSNTITLLRKSKIIKTRLESLDKSNHSSSEGTHIHRTRIAVTNGLRLKLKAIMNDSQCLREKIGGVVEESMEENQERDEGGVKEIQRSLVQLHQIFLDMAVIVETQSEGMNNIEMNVVKARDYVNGERMKKRKGWACWIGIVVVLVFLFVCVIAILF